MKITVIAVGKIKEKWLLGGIEEYTKRLKRFVKLEILEVPDQRVPEKYSEKEVLIALEKEEKAILGRWPKDAWAIALSPNGEQLGSQGLSDLIALKTVDGTSHFLFLIGGSNGLSQALLDRCQRRLSFGKNTFPHQLFRVMLLEQIYRAEKIRTGEPYHK